MRATVDSIITIKITPNEILENASALTKVLGAGRIRSWIAQSAMADPSKSIPITFPEQQGRAVLEALNLIPVNKIIEVRGEEQTYLVTMNIGTAVRCTCAQNVYHGTPCEHMQEAQAEHNMKKLAKQATKNIDRMQA